MIEYRTLSKFSRQTAKMLPAKRLMVKNQSERHASSSRRTTSMAQRASASGAPCTTWSSFHKSQRLRAKPQKPRDKGMRMLEPVRLGLASSTVAVSSHLTLLAAYFIATPCGEQKDLLFPHYAVLRPSGIVWFSYKETSTASSAKQRQKDFKK